MESLKIITGLTLALTGFMAAGITVRTVYLILAGIMAGEAILDVLKKVKKKLSAAILAICLSSLLEVIRRYYF